MTKQLLSKNRIRTGYIVSFLLLFLSYVLLFYVQQRQVKEAAWVIHSYMVVNKSESLKAKVTDAETGMRGYVITRDTGFLQAYRDATEDLPVLVNELKTLVADNAEQLMRLDSLNQLIARRVSTLQNGLTNIRANSFIISGDWIQKRYEGQRNMDSVRLYVSKLTMAEQKLMSDRKERLSDLFQGAEIMAIISLVIILAALVYSLITFNMENREKERAVKRADQYMEDLESNKNELKEKDEEIKELKDMEKFTTTGRIARTIAHEVRNPLTNILLATEQLKESENRTEESSVLLDLINRNASRINQLVSDLLNATRFTHLDFVQVDINQLLDETITMAKDRIDLNKIHLEKNYLSGKCEVCVDREKIKVALLNVIVNAIEAMDHESKKKLELRTRKEDGKCIIEIRDFGKGMDDEALQKLFDPYFTTKIKGNGLGLTNTQSIILNHNGKINVLSKPGNGTLFSITLELAEESNK